MKKLACILGIIFSVLLIAAGVVMMLEGVPTLMNGELDMLEYDGMSLGYYAGGTSYRGTQVTAASAGSYSGTTVTSTSFGADFYTYSYRATRAAAHNINELGESLETTGGNLLQAVTANTNNVYYLGVYLDDVMDDALAVVCGVENSVNELGEFTSELAASVVGGAVIVIGVFGALLSLFGLGCCSADKKRLALLERIAAGAAAPVAPVAVPAAPAKEWACRACGHANAAQEKVCSVCGEKKAQ